MVWIELSAGGVNGFGEATPQDHYGESVASATRFSTAPGTSSARIRSHSRRSEPVSPRCPARWRQGGHRRGAARSLRQALRSAVLARAGPAPGEPGDVVHDRARRPGRHGPARRGARERRGSLPAPEAGALGWPRCSRRRSSASRAGRDHTAAPGRRQRVLDARRGAGLDPLFSASGVEYVEQPLPAGDPDGPELKRHSCLPMYVDEDCHTLADVAPARSAGTGSTSSSPRAGGCGRPCRWSRRYQRWSWASWSGAWSSPAWRSHRPAPSRALRPR